MAATEARAAVAAMGARAAVVAAVPAASSRVFETESRRVTRAMGAMEVPAAAGAVRADSPSDIDPMVVAAVAGPATACEVTVPSAEAVADLPAGVGDPQLDEINHSVFDAEIADVDVWRRDRVGASQPDDRIDASSFLPAEISSPMPLLSPSCPMSHSLEKAIGEDTASIGAEHFSAILQLLSGLARENRDALQCAQSCLDLLELGLDDADEQRRLVDRIRLSLSELRQNFEDMKGYARRSSSHVR